MPTTLYLRGELPVKPGHEQAVDALRETLCIEPGDEFDFDGQTVSLYLNVDVSYGTYEQLRKAVSDFVAEHCAGAVVFQTGDEEASFVVVGGTEEERIAAHRAYCDEQVAYWTDRRNKEPVGLVRL